MELFWQNIQHEEHRNNGKSTMCGTTMIKVGGVTGSDDGGRVRWCKQFLLLPRERNTSHSRALNYIVRTIYGGGQEAWRGKLCMHLDQLQSYICWSTISDSVRWLPAFPISQNSFFVLLMISIVVVVVVIIIMYTHLNNTDMTLV